MSSAGDKSTATEVDTLALSGIGVEGEWREIVKENSWDGEEDAEGGDVGDCCFAAIASFPSCFDFLSS